MNKYLQLSVLIISLNIISCKKTTSENKPVQIEKQSEFKIEDSTFENTAKNPEERVLTKHYEYLFAIAMQGLNYRDSPKGNILGKFPLNTQLKIIDSTKVTDQIKEGEKIIKGEWLGVEKGKDTVYVFNGFLSNLPLQSDIHLYYISSYYKQDKITRTAFLNLSDSYFANVYLENGDRKTSPILNEESEFKDTIRLNQNQKSKLLKEINISNSDSIFIYQIGDDTIKTFSVKNLPTIACLNIYVSKGDYSNGENDYEFGFDLGKKYQGGDNFVFIGKENPFQTGKIKPLIWKKIDEGLFPINRKKIEHITESDAYVYSFKNFKYYIQTYRYENGKNNRVEGYHLAVLDTISNLIISQKYYQNSESISLNPLSTQDEKTEYNYSWTGELFKNKPPILYGFENNSFGCPEIEFINETEPPIYILCDNRH